MGVKMSWVLGCFYKQKSYTDNLVAELRPIDGDEDEIVNNCRCGRNVFSKINRVINTVASPIFVFFRTIADYEMRNSPDLVQISLLSYSYHCTRNPVVAKEILKWHRSDSSVDGKFTNTLIGQGMTVVANKIFSPKKMISAKDSILACDREDHTMYAKFLNQFFNPRSIKAHFGRIEAIIENNLMEFEKEDSEFVINEKIKFLATSVMANVFLGINDSLENISSATCNIIPWISEEVTRNFSSIYNFLVDYIPKLRFASDSDKAYTINILSGAVKKAIKDARYNRGDSNSIVSRMIKEGYNNNQIKSMIMTLFVAGQDNVSTSLTHSLLKLAQDPELQKAIREENASPLDSSCIEALLCESLRMMCPISGISRTASKDLMMTITKKNSRALVSKTLIKKGDLLAPLTYLIAKDPSIFKNPEKFDPTRFAGGTFLSNLKHKPFGDGPHMCPGWYLYYVIAKLTISKIVIRNHLTTTFKKEPTPKVGIVVSLADKITMKMKKIDFSN